MKKSRTILIATIVFITLLMCDAFFNPASATYNYSAVPAPQITNILLNNLDSSEFLLGVIVGFGGALWKLKPEQRLRAIEKRQQAAIKNQEKIHDVIIQCFEQATAQTVKPSRQLNPDGFTDRGGSEEGGDYQ